MSPESPYDDGFYAAISAESRESAIQVLPIVVDLIKPRSVVDVGCGAGDWLGVMADMADCEILGLDGGQLSSDRLAIPSESFVPTDLSQPVSLGRCFDLAMSLEVAEHLHPGRSEGFVGELVGLAPAVLFGAAVPGQGGVGHVNEQWQSYWVKLFEQRDYQVLDVIRPALWDNRGVNFWYRQNTMLFVDPDVHPPSTDLAPPIVDLVHPEALEAAQAPDDPPSLRELVTMLPGAAGRSVRYRLGRARRRIAG